VKYYGQVVSEALLADPPRIRGYLDGDMLRRLIRYEGRRGSRKFLFDIIGWVDFRDLIKRKDLVALAPALVEPPLTVNAIKGRRNVPCPHCGLEQLGVQFWTHYNLFHARRVNWLNREDWSKMGLGEYQTPPEQR